MSADAERAVIGAALLDPNMLRFAVEHITPDDFADRRLGAAYGIMLGPRGAGEPLDEMVVAERLKATPWRLGLTELFECRESTPTSKNIAYYARIVADSAGKRRLEKFADNAGQLSKSGLPFADLMRDLRREWEQVNTHTIGGISAPTLRSILDGPDDYDWLIPNLLERHDRVIVTGGEGAGKSYWIQQMALLSAAGIHPTTFHPIQPVRVLVVDAENSDKQWRRRVRALAIKAAQEGTCDPRDTMHLATVPRLNITDERDLGAVHRLIDEHTPDLLMIGPLYRLIPRAIQSDDDAAPMIAALDGLRARGCALVMEAHAGHAKDGAGDRDLRPRGSSALMGWPEFGFGLRLMRPDDESDTTVRAELTRWRGDRDERAWPTVMRRGPDWPWMDDNPAATAATYHRRINPYTEKRTA